MVQGGQPALTTGYPSQQPQANLEQKPSGYAQPVVMSYYNYDGTGASQQQQPGNAANYVAYAPYQAPYAYPVAYPPN